MVSTHAEAVDSELCLLLDWGLRPSLRLPKMSTIVRWKLSRQGWINFDGARKADGPRTGAGFVVRASDGGVVAATAIPVVN